jgi:methylated-DNA-[protein]-cysteine S-methyltransferase
VIIETAELDTPIGPLVLAVRGGKVCTVGFDRDGSRMQAMLRQRFPDAKLRRVEDPAGAVTRLRAYFDGDLTVLDAIPVDLGGTPFQAKVWNALRRIPAGQTMSYRDLALAIGKPKAVRAVGLANGANPVAIVVPCHRVIGADGSLTGFGGGLHVKRYLLEHEGALLPLG